MSAPGVARWPRSAAARPNLSAVGCKPLGGRLDRVPRFGLLQREIHNYRRMVTDRVPGIQRADLDLLDLRHPIFRDEAVVEVAVEFWACFPL